MVDYRHQAGDTERKERGNIAVISKLTIVPLTVIFGRTAIESAALWSACSGISRLVKIVEKFRGSKGRLTCQSGSKWKNSAI
jgi:hypothetical protein